MKPSVQRENLGALGGPRDAFCHRAQWERHDEEDGPAKPTAVRWRDGAAGFAADEGSTTKMKSPSQWE